MWAVAAAQIKITKIGNTEIQFVGGGVRCLSALHSRPPSSHNIILAPLLVAFNGF